MDKNKCTCGKKNCDCDKKFDSKDLVCGADSGNKLGDYTVTVTGYLDYATNKFKMMDISNRSKTVKKNPYVPKAIYSDPDMDTTVVEWQDGTKTKVSCAEEDVYSWEAGYYAALAIKVLADGKKADMKNKWLPVLSRRVKEVGISSTGSTTFKKIEPFPYGKWEDEQEKRKETKKIKKLDKKHQQEQECLEQKEKTAQEAKDAKKVKSWLNKGKKGNKTTG